MLYRAAPGKSMLTQHICVMPNRCVPGEPLNVIWFSTKCKLGSVGNNEGWRSTLQCDFYESLLCSWKECLLRMLLSEPCCFPPLTRQSKVSHFHPPSGFHSSYRMFLKCNKTTVVNNSYWLDCGQKKREIFWWSKEQCRSSSVVRWPRRQSQIMQLLSVCTSHWAASLSSA